MTAEVTPTEELIMEVLAARFRLGEKFWTFGNHPTSVRAARRLEERGFVYHMSGQVERTFRLGLTEQGIDEWKLNKPYKPPHPVARTTKTRSDDWKAGFDAGWDAREGGRP